MYNNMSDDIRVVVVDEFQWDRINIYKIICDRIESDDEWHVQRSGLENFEQDALLVDAS